MSINGTGSYRGGPDQLVSVRATCHTIDSPPFYALHSGYGFVDPDNTTHIMAPSLVVGNTLGQDKPCWRAMDNGIFYAQDGSGWALVNGTPTSKSGEMAGWEDANGNTLQNNGSQILDTVGRIYTTDGSYYDESGTLQRIGVQTEQVSISTH
ncbi:MAG TPA: hypothetical protein VN647_01900, partial [Nitrospira sp.]|nr:hypothetical protein [Nitrospira sp.]